MYILLALVSGLFYTVSGLLTRYVLKGSKDAWAFSLYFSAVGALVTLPFLVGSLKLPATPYPWLFLAVAGLGVVFQNFLSFSASKYLPASVSGVVTKLRLLWTMLLGIAILGEKFSMMKAGGMALVIAGSLIVMKKTVQGGSRKGLSLAVAATVIYSAVIILYKFMFPHFGSVTLTFFIFLIPALLNALGMPDAKNRIVSLYREKGPAVLIACALGGCANIAMNHALSIGEAGKVLVVIESFLVLTLAGEHIVLRERGHLIFKAIGVGLALAGAVLNTYG